MFTTPKTHLVHDPNSSLRTGDVVSIVPGWPTSQKKRHVVKQIIAPFGAPIEERPPIPTESERIEARDAEKAEKDQRRHTRRVEAAETQEQERVARLKAKTTTGGIPSAS